VLEKENQRFSNPHTEIKNFCLFNSYEYEDFHRKFRKMEKINMKSLDNVTKILLILLIGVIIYFVMFLILRVFFVREPTSMMEMMSQMINSNSNSFTINIISIIIAIAISFILSFYLFKQNEKEQEYTLIRKVLSEDEKKILDEIKKSEEITQDSLRFRLDWSKAKVSTILTNLDKKGLIQRERIGKTYKVYLQNNKN